MCYIYSGLDQYIVLYIHGIDQYIVLYIHGIDKYVVLYTVSVMIELVNISIYSTIVIFRIV